MSRGAIVAAGAGALVFLALRGLGDWRRTLAAVVPLAVVVGVAFHWLPEDVQTRATDYSRGDSATALSNLTSAQYALRLRDIYRENGWELVNSHPAFGVGPGNYVTGAPGSPEYNTDPHDLIIRTAGDVGYPGLVGFLILVGGTTALAVNRRRVNPYAAVAVAVQVSIIVHGFVDVYWVRGTPVLGWLLIGMALNHRLDEVREPHRRGSGGLSQRRSPRSLPVLASPRPVGVGDRQLQ
jgi:O-antigen ligase